MINEGKCKPCNSKSSEHHSDARSWKVEVVEKPPKIPPELFFIFTISGCAAIGGIAAYFT